jgi:hypothetical protein
VQLHIWNLENNRGLEYQIRGGTDAATDLFLEYLSTISSGTRPLNSSFDNPLKYLNIAQVPAFINIAMNIFIAGP